MIQNDKPLNDWHDLLRSEQSQQMFFNSTELKFISFKSRAGWFNRRLANHWADCSFGIVGYSV